MSLNRISKAVGVEMGRWEAREDRVHAVLSLEDKGLHTQVIDETLKEGLAQTPLKCSVRLDRGWKLEVVAQEDNVL